MKLQKKDPFPCYTKKELIEMSDEPARVFSNSRPSYRRLKRAELKFEAKIAPAGKFERNVHRQIMSLIIDDINHSIFPG